ncbi:MAG TPA: prepilin-type N-terminal cleavage/methylation domain-containing protein [Thermodesulfobacteriota bacterium]|nr:prepilin-type N-terminal cleavage/methylation domain-containing protein [Deltaproteobacteria bacterium]HOC39428.1 prepilin-type N-terminal cleavage/methylation domain-containing protein [Thermodesulfobacteriota bacterium]
MTTILRSPLKFIRSATQGMTLIEVALVLVILGLLAGMSMPLVTELTKQRHYRSTQRDLDEIKHALAGYAGIYGRLPTADTNGDGQADENQLSGTLPYLDLGLGAVDAWRSTYWYDVNSRLTLTTDASSFCEALAAVADGEVPPLAFANGGPATPQAAVVLSRGENSTLDGENADGDRAYESFIARDGFDDLLISINPNTLFGKRDCTSTGGNTASSRHKTPRAIPEPLPPPPLHQVTRTSACRGTSLRLNSNQA